MMVYKVLRPAEWSALQAEGATQGSPADLADGFVHLSTAAQLRGTLTKHFGDESILILLACDAEAFGSALRWEPSRGGDLFPHLYRPLSIADLSWSRTIHSTGNGHETGPLE